MSANQHNAASPDCPECGCNATELIDAGMRWRRAWARFRCDHCSNEFTLGQGPVRVKGFIPYWIDHPKIKCPRCRSVRIENKSSPAAVNGVKERRHNCLECGYRFGSREQLENAG